MCKGTQPRERCTRNKKFTHLNETVDEYLVTRSEEKLKKILDSVGGLIRNVLFSYNIYSMPPTVIEDVEADCKSRVVHTALNTYDKSKGSFSTHFYWQLCSFVAYRKRYYTKRFSLVSGPSLNQPSEDNTSTLSESITKYHPRTYHTIKRGIHDIFAQANRHIPGIQIFKVVKRDTDHKELALLMEN